MFNSSSLSVNRRTVRWILLAAVLGLGLGQPAYAAPVPKKEEPKKVEPQPRPQVPGLIFPDLDNLFPNIQPGVFPMGPDEMRRQIEEMHRLQQKALEDIARAMQQQRAGIGRFPGVRGQPAVGRGTAAHEGRLGAMIDVPSATLVDQLDLPKEQGVVVNDVVPDSAAAKAGMKAHDILLEMDGQPVPSKIDEFVKQMDAIKANTPVDAVVLRKGRKETLKGISLPEMPKDIPNLPRNGRGARLNPLLPDLPNVRAGRGAAITVTRSDDQVSARYQEGALVLTLAGRVEDGKVKVESLIVQDGDAAAQKYESVDKVPEQYHEQSKKLLEGAQKGAVRVEVR